MLTTQAQEQIRVDDLAEMPQLLVLVETGERRPIGGAVAGEGIGAFPMRDSTLPLQISAAIAPESRHHVAELRVHTPAVIALVVVLDDDLPVRCDVVMDGVPNP